MRRFRSMACCLLLLSAFVAVPALATGAESTLPTGDAVALRLQQERIRDALVARKGVFQDFDVERSAALKKQLDLVIASLQGVQRTTDLSPAKQGELVNALSSIQAIVTTAEDARVICERGRRTGTHLRVTTCKTVAERREERRAVENGIKRDIRCTDAWNSGACRSD